ncbi:hypothetical protein LKK83_04715, partial [Phormidium sp. CCY1219]|nr:hypothetical protein [Phormidium sp. CCY1219]
MLSVVADTHTLIWYVFDLPRLSPAALTALEQAANGGDFIYFSAISIVKISALLNLLWKVATKNAIKPLPAAILSPLQISFLIKNRQGWP